MVSFEQIQRRIVAIRPNALLWEAPEDRHPDLEEFGLYNWRLSLIAVHVTPDAAHPHGAALTEAGKYYGIREEEAHLWLDTYVSKWGWTSVSFVCRGHGLVNEITSGKGFPTEGLNPYFAAGIIGLPCNRKLLRVLEAGLRNRLKDANLRLPYYAQFLKKLKRNKSLLSESFEYSILRGAGDEIYAVYEAYARLLEAGRVVAVKKLKELRATYALDISNALRPLRLKHKGARARLQHKQNRQMDVATTAGANLEVVRARHEREKLMLQQRHARAIERAKHRLRDDIPAPDPLKVLSTALLYSALPPHLATRALEIMARPEEVIVDGEELEELDAPDYYVDAESEEEDGVDRQG